MLLQYNSAHSGSSQSGWRTMTWSAGSHSDNWGHAVPALGGLGTRAAPQFIEGDEDSDPDMIDWDWNELEEFENRIESTP